MTVLAEDVQEAVLLTRRVGDLVVCVDRAELDPDVVGIVAPIHDEAGRVVAAVSVAALASRISEEREPEIDRKVRDAAREIGNRLAVVAG